MSLPARHRPFAALLGAVLLIGIVATVDRTDGDPEASHRSAHSITPPKPVTPIEHLVVIFGENISFDHYFGRYPDALNPPGEPPFHAAPATPPVNGLRGRLLTHNGNLTNPGNGSAASNPFRLDRTQAATADQAHAYTAEQLAYNGGAADLFPRYTGRATSGGVGAFGTAALVMGYFDGNTVTAMWNYAQHFALNDNSYGNQYGPSTPGAINLISGQTNGLVVTQGSSRSYAIDDGQGGLTLINDVQPAGDSCSTSGNQAYFKGRNIGDLLNEAGVSWGWFQGGFDLTVVNADSTTGCHRRTWSPITRRQPRDYVPHHEPFQYYRSTANLQHLRPTEVQSIGQAGDRANHQYDIHDFFDAINAGDFPSVAFLKASAFQDAHAGNSNPLDEQTFVVQVLNFLQQRPEWAHTAVIILYDDSDGWYDHQFTPVTNPSFSTADRLNGVGICGARGTPQLGGVAGNGPVNGRCGPGTRQPLLVISPWARPHFVDHTLTIQSSVMRFIEDNWLDGTRLGGGSFDAVAGSITGMFDFKSGGHVPPLLLDDSFGTPTTQPSPTLPR